MKNNVDLFWRTDKTINQLIKESIAELCIWLGAFVLMTIIGISIYFDPDWSSVGLNAIVRWFCKLSPEYGIYWFIGLFDFLCLYMTGHWMRLKKRYEKRLSIEKSLETKFGVKSMLLFYGHSINSVWEIGDHYIMAVCISEFIYSCYEIEYDMISSPTKWSEFEYDITYYPEKYESIKMKL